MLCLAPSSTNWTPHVTYRWSRGYNDINESTKRTLHGADKDENWLWPTRWPLISTPHSQLLLGYGHIDCTSSLDIFPSHNNIFGPPVSSRPSQLRSMLAISRNIQNTLMCSAKTDHDDFTKILWRVYIYTIYVCSFAQIQHVNLDSAFPKCKLVCNSFWGEFERIKESYWSGIAIWTSVTNTSNETVEVD